MTKSPHNISAPRRSAQSGARRHSRAFTMVELLVVAGIMTTLAVVSIPALQLLREPAGVNQAAADLSRTLELARVYAMANRTHVNVLFTQLPPQDSRIAPATAAMMVYSADGTTVGDLADVQAWPVLDKPLVMEDLLVFDQLQGAAPNSTAADVTPMGENTQGAMAVPITRELPGAGTVDFTGMIQFTPSGEARVSSDEPARYIKIALDRPQPGSTTASMKRNPVILRLSGTNGTVKTLRAEDMVL